MPRPRKGLLTMIGKRTTVVYAGPGTVLHRPVQRSCLRCLLLLPAQTLHAFPSTDRDGTFECDGVIRTAHVSTKREKQAMDCPPPHLISDCNRDQGTPSACSVPEQIVGSPGRGVS